MWPFKKKKKKVDLPFEETPVEEEISAEETPVEEAPVEETPVEETHVEEASVEETPVEEAPVEETPVEEAPVEETPVEEEDPFGLDAIMREFSTDETPREEAEPVTSDTVRIELPVQTEEAEPVTSDTVRIEMPVTSDTVRIDVPVTSDTVRIDVPVTSDTVRIDLPEEVTADTVPGDQPEGQEPVTGDTVRFDPITDGSQKAEPYSEGWEPEYEQPMGEYIPPQPILFHPRSRLRELKRKLVAGPERRYYEISEQGFVKLQFAIFFCLLVAVLSTGATVFYELGLLTERIKLVAFAQLFGMLIAALLGTYQLMDGVADMFNKRFSLNSLLVFSFLACIADGVFCLKAQRVPCCAAFTVQMTMSLWSTYQNRSTEMGQMDTMRKATRLDSIVECPDYHEGMKGLLRSEGQVEDFMDHYRERSTADKITTVYAIAACLVALASGVTAGVLRQSVEFGVQVLATSLLVSVPGTFFIAQSRPMAILEKRLHKLGTVLCGWQRSKQLCGKAVFPLGHEDLFPSGCTMLNGVKFYGDRDPDQVVEYATAVVAADGGGLTPLFEHLLSSRNGRNYDVENLRLYGGGGIGGEVCGEPVLVGMLGFLKEMGVEIPEGTMVDQAVYVAIDGELSGLFAVSTTKTKAASQGLATLCSYRSLKPMLVTGDFMLTEEFIRDSFGVNSRRIHFPAFEVRAQLAQVTPEKGLPALALTTQDGLASFAYAITGARSVRTATMLGTIIHLVGGALGLGIVLTLALLNASALLTPVNMLLYQLIWMIPGLLITEWTRSI